MNNELIVTLTYNLRLNLTTLLAETQCLNHIQEKYLTVMMIK